jgi:nucleoside-diphosphate-sugar epimerase
MIEKAIITGSTGLVGQSLAKFLANKKVDVICLGRQNLSKSDCNDMFGKEVKYLQLDMNSILDLEDILDNLNWIINKNCVFYHLAWQGVQRLTDGSIEDQLQNVTFSSNAIKIAKKIGCSQFINSGTIEETYAEWYLDKGSKFNSTQGNYAIAKLASRDMCFMTAYLEKINYIHTRLSVPISSDLSIGGYIPQTLNKIISNQDYDIPKNEQLFDIISTKDVAYAYYLLGSKSLNKLDYYIGYGKPAKLSDYFLQFEKYIKGLSIDALDYSDVFSYDFFDNKLLCSDTAFIPSYNQYNFFEKQ